MRNFLTLLLLTAIFSNCYSQDVIRRKNGETINCEIQGENDSLVYFKQIRNSYPIETYIRRNDIRSIEYGVVSEEKQLQKQTQTQTQTQIQNDPFTIGVGLGMDYGGFGFNLLLCPHESFGIFGGIGYALAGYSYNIGVKINILPKTRVNPYLLGMYGYNAVIAVKDNSEYSKFFYGPTLGVGLDFKSPHRNNYWSLAILIPIRKGEVNDYINYLEDEVHVKFDTELMPVGISIGYRFGRK